MVGIPPNLKKRFPEEVFRDNFDLVDTDRDGWLSKEEVGILYRGLGQTPTDGELKDLLQEIEEKTELNGFKNFFIKNYKQPLSEEELIEAFRVFDPTNSGRVTTARFREIVTGLGDALTEAEVEEIIKAARIDPRGSIDYVAFASLITSSAKSILNVL
jgi:calmodulin